MNILDKKCPHCGNIYQVKSQCFLKYRKFCSKPCAVKFQIKNNPREKQFAWKGGESIHKSGYIMIRLKSNEFPNKIGRYVMKHRFIMEEYLGKKISKNQDVHHINGDKQDNRIQNLIVLTKKEHQNSHHKKYLPRKCFNCKNIINNPRKNTKFCSHKCHMKLLHG